MVRKQKSKRKTITGKLMDNIESDYEKKARYDIQDEKPSKPMLPIKLSDGTFVPQFLEYDDAPEDLEFKKDENVKKDEEMIIPETIEELVLRRNKILDQTKTKIVSCVNNIMADPQANLKSLKDLRTLTDDYENPECCATIRKLAVTATSKVFVDILPDYRIRERSEEEKKVKLTKETKHLVEYEEGLLRNYQLFLKSLEKKILNRNRPGESRLLSKQAQESIGEKAIDSLCDLYLRTLNFNFHKNVCILIVQCAFYDVDPQVRARCCDSIKKLFQKDKKGLATYETVQKMAKTCKVSKAHKIHVEILDVLKYLRINRVDYSMLAPKNKHEKKKLKDEKQKMSRRERKKLKKQQALRNELKETAASEDVDEKIKFHTETIQHVFWIYFRILKMKRGDTRHLLSTVLQGLSDFAHLINIEFFPDLLNVLRELVTSSKLSLQESLSCISTAFKVLSGQGEVLNIDPVDFYRLTHQLLYDVTAVTRTQDCDHDVKILLDCLDMMITKRRKQITTTCLCSFIKRLLAASLHTNSNRSVLLLLNEAQKLFHLNSKTSSLFFTESQDIGVYDHEEDDPLHSGSTSAVVWDLHLLRRHYVPDVSKTADRFLVEGMKRTSSD